MYDLHIHSSYSDGVNTPEEIVLAGIELGYAEIAVCDHVRATTDWFDSFYAEMERLKKKYEGRITVYSAVEAKVTPEGLDIRPEFYLADYVFAALHTFPGDKVEAFKVMLESPADGIVHPFRGLSDKEAREIIPLLLEYGKPLEVSAKYFSEHYESLKGRVPLFVGSDSHSVEEMYTGGVTMGDIIFDESTKLIIKEETVEEEKKDESVGGSVSPGRRGFGMRRHNREARRKR